MAFTINIYYTGSNGSAKQFAEEMINSGIVYEIRNKKGNLRNGIHTIEAAAELGFGTREYELIEID